MEENTIHILWDESHIWGIMAWRAMLAFGLPCRLVKAKEIAQQGLLGKREKAPAALLAPGGGARLKSRALGLGGREAIRKWLAAGGFYMGFCGGAGLALSHKREEEGLALCPWGRAEYPHRFFHLLSGHVRAAREDAPPIPLPVWWPARFARRGGDDARVLASYLSPGPDLWLADLPLARMPGHVLDSLRDDKGVDARLNFPAGQPLAICGNYGAGKYLLSYAHLETPDSPQANIWLAQLMEKLGGIKPMRPICPPWHCAGEGERAGGKNFPPQGGKGNFCPGLEAAHKEIVDLLGLGAELGIFFRRTSWLLGWRAGISGMACNNLLASISTLASIKPTEKALGLWEREGSEFCASLARFRERAEAFFWNWRLERTAEINFPGGGGGDGTAMESAELFGHPMLGGGLAKELLNFLQEMLYLSQENHKAEFF